MLKCVLGEKPKNDRAYFEMMTKVIFRSGLNHKVIDAKWGHFKATFASFDFSKVARFTEERIDKLITDKNLVRNYGKLSATVNNAKEFLEIKKEHGSFSKYLKELGKAGEEHLCKSISKRFSYMGGSTVVFFLRSVGEELPETMKLWNSRRLS